jgi:hypothetical protein
MASFFVGVAASNRYDGSLFHHEYQSIAMERIIIYLPVVLHQAQSCHITACRTRVPDSCGEGKLSLSLTLTIRLIIR